MCGVCSVDGGQEFESILVAIASAYIRPITVPLTVRCGK